MKVAHFTVHGTAAQSARWKQAAEAEGFPSAGQWLAAAADAYLKARARAGAPVPLAWRRGHFMVRLDGEERIAQGHLSPPFGAFRGDGEGRGCRYSHLYRLVYLPTGRVLATLRRYQEARALASELARQWLRESEEPPLPALLGRPAVYPGAIRLDE